jgi:hypothetical protein
MIDNSLSSYEIKTKFDRIFQKVDEEVKTYINRYFSHKLPLASFVNSEIYFYKIIELFIINLGDQIKTNDNIHLYSKVLGLVLLEIEKHFQKFKSKSEINSNSYLAGIQL